MRCVLLEFYRFYDLDEPMWHGGAPYLVAAGSYPIRQITMPIKQEDFLDLIAALRYQGDGNARSAALGRIGELATDFVGDDCIARMSGGEFPVQLDLVVNASELAAVPFETATTATATGRQPVFVRADRPIVITRRVRHDFATDQARWPARPRILFVWAAPPNVGEVPYEEHEAALRAALEPWSPIGQRGIGLVADPSSVLTTVQRATLGAIERACRTAVDTGEPFTHVHILAHGYPVGETHRQRYGIALHGDDGDLDAVTPEQLTAALAPLVGQTVAITLATCDSANAANMITSQKNIAHQMHVAGFPIVIASQLPFTVAGSNVVVDAFYSRVLMGVDVRIALHETRLALYDAQQSTGHDWASLVGYVRLPENYADHLLDVRLEGMFTSLKTMQAWSDKLVNAGGNLDAFDYVARQLRARVEALDGFRRDSENAPRRGVLEENLGLLGSGEKRLAELSFVRSKLGDATEWRQGMQDALRRAREWYRKGYEWNLSGHWNGVQFLSLDAVLDGRIADVGWWYAAMAAATLDAGRAHVGNAIWALGSMVELQLLAPLTGQPQAIAAARGALQRMKALVMAQPKPDTFPLESTERQLRRYVDWWIGENGFFPGTTDLSVVAAALLEELKR